MISSLQTSLLNLNKNKTFRLLYDKKFGLKERNLAEQFKF